MWVWLAACASPPAPPSPDAPVLEVVGGYGGGAHAPGAEVWVRAAVDPQRELADWEPDPALRDPAEWTTALTMPDRDLTVSARLTPVPVPAEDRSYPLPAGPRRVRVAPHPAPVGGVLFLHGARYAVDQLHDNAAWTHVMHLHRAGWAVAAPASEAETRSGTGGWDPALDPAGNVDLANVAALVDALRADETFPVDGPVVAWGMSSGGIFAHTLGAAGLVDGVVAHCAPGTPEALAVTEAPTAWFLAAADRTFPDGAAQAATFQADLRARGVRSLLVVHPVTPLHDERFTRVAGIDLALSTRLAASARAAGAPEVPVDPASLDGADGLSADQLEAVNAELEITAADHELYDDHAAGMLAFVESLR